jgi:predicted DNA-binding WGR domain protein
MTPIAVRAHRRNAARPRRPATELPGVVRFRQYARFERRDASQNCERFYALSWQPLLWGGIALIRSWGRIGSQGTQRLEGSYPDRQSAQLLAERLIRRRLTRRYELVDWT